MAALKPPTVQQLVDIIAEYNKARELELRNLGNRAVPADYKNPLMEKLYDAACLAADNLKPALTVPIHSPP